MLKMFSTRLMILTVSTISIIDAQLSGQKDMVCTLDHSAVLNENGVEVEVSVRNAKRTHDDGYLNLNFKDGKFADIEDIPAWCVDLGRSIRPKTYSTDVFSSMAPDVSSFKKTYPDAVDKFDMLPALNWMINHRNSGMKIDVNNCVNEHKITDQEFQLAVWTLVDDHDVEEDGALPWTKKGGFHQCVVDYLVEEAKKKTEYELDCNDPDEYIGIAVIVDDDDNVIQKQVLVMEIKLADTTVCDCVAPATEKTNKPTKNPTQPPKIEKTNKPTKNPTQPPKIEKTNKPTKNPTQPPKFEKTPTTNSPTRAIAPIIGRRGITPAPTEGRAFGDPHFMTWAGDYFDFHGVCDLVLMKNPQFGNGLGMDIHMRSSIMRVWSYISNAAIRIGNDILEIVGGKVEDNFWINGVPEGNEKTKYTNRETTLRSTLSGFSIHLKQPNSKRREFAIDLGDNEKIVVKTWNLMVSVYLENAKYENFQNGVGLMGSFPEGIKLARDNTSVIDELETFGQEWQVLSSEQNLFRYKSGPQHPTRCEIPTHSEMRRRLVETTITVKQAKKVCDTVSVELMNMCVFDVMATNDASTAGAY